VNNTNPGGLCAFVAKVSAGGMLAWSSYLGGSGSDVGYSIALDASGKALVAGSTGSPDFAGANNTNPGGTSAFVAKITPPGAVVSVIGSQFHYETAPPRVTIEFDADVSARLTLVELSLANLTTDEQVPVGMLALEFESDGRVARLTFPGHAGGVSPDGVYRLIVQAGESGLSQDHLFEFFVLAGDANRDGKVDIADLGITAANWQQSPRHWHQGDFNYDDLVGIADLGILAGNWQKELDLSLLEQAQAVDQSPVHETGFTREPSQSVLALQPPHAAALERAKAAPMGPVPHAQRASNAAVVPAPSPVAETAGAATNGQKVSAVAAIPTAPPRWSYDYGLFGDVPMSRDRLVDPAEEELLVTA
jgi:hypothetical protein